jgi:hypothetical protein
MEMLNSKMVAGFVAAGVLAVVGLSASSIASDAKDSSSRYRCDARGAGQIRLHVRYENRARPGRDRQIFNAEFEVVPNRGFTAGQQIVFSVDSVVVGSKPLKLVAATELSAELELDTNNVGIKQPIPPNFPAVTAGTLVEASLGGKTLLGCELNRE